MNIANVYELLERFDASGLSELEVELEGAAIRMKKASDTAVHTAMPGEQRIAGEQQIMGDQQILKIQKETPAGEEASDTAEAQPAYKTLKAPLAGTFYTSPSPEAEPFVQKGQKVKKGDVIGIIEAMKLMNEVTAEEDGIVEEIMVADATLIGYDEVLMRYV